MRRVLEPVDTANVQIPYYFRCPISLELMQDPVTVCTGQTYDRSSIESWVSTGNFTCPVTRLPLTDFTLIPNHTLRRLIQDWCVANRSFGIERIPTPKQPADPGLVRSLLNQASSDSGHLSNRVSALKRLRVLARESDKNRVVISGTDLFEVLMKIVFSDMDAADSVSGELKYESIAILSLFHLPETECVLVASDPDRVGYLVGLLYHSSIEVRVNSAALIEIVVAGTKSAELRAEMSNADGIFEGIVGVLNYQFAYPRAVKIAVKALFTLCLVKQHRHKAVNAGAVAALIDRLAESDKCDSERALATVELLCRIPSGCDEFASHALTVPLLVKIIILKISDRATEYATGALVSLCTSSDQAQREAVEAGIMTQLLLLVQSDCTQRAKKKAQLLLKNLMFV